jgi:hypothetical protein
MLLGFGDHSNPIHFDFRIQRDEYNDSFQFQRSVDIIPPVRMKGWKPANWTKTITYEIVKDPRRNEEGLLTLNPSSDILKNPRSFYDGDLDNIMIKEITSDA